jgi:RNA polymerase sigma-70 factor (ECF subfamily)
MLQRVNNSSQQECMMRPTAELVRASQSDDRVAFAELVRRYQRAVLSTAWSVLHDYHSAQDVAQDSFFEAYRNLGSLRDARTFGPWLLTLTKRAAVKRSQKIRVAVAIESVPESSLCTAVPAWNEPFADLVKGIGRLPVHEQEVVVFHYIDGYSAAEVAELTGRPIGTVTKQLSRAIHRLREWLAEVHQ